MRGIGSCGGLLSVKHFPEADIGFRQSQASLIWQELEEEEDERGEESSASLLHSRLWRRREEGRWHHQQQQQQLQQQERISDYSDDDYVRYFVLGTLAALLALASNQTLFGTDLDPEGPPQLTPEVTSDLFAHSGDCAAPSYSNMEEVD
ncbi:hypothetical protein JZ751_014571 [Albula glossodonta]|uniref:Uncharacterized protein n=1 Tax=Albula glossodonta TaxID=121402 RepID=A0A8T2MXN9_9TELE|nr:hypothetical protein JZ751_014571 [Albula glossodonta]